MSFPTNEIFRASIMTNHHIIKIAYKVRRYIPIRVKLDVLRTLEVVKDSGQVKQRFSVTTE